MAERTPSVELYYDPAEPDPDAPRLHIRENGSRWELRDACGALLSGHAQLPEAIDAALERSSARFSEIIVHGAGGKVEWSVHQSPVFVEFARVLARGRATWPASLIAAMDAETLQLTFEPHEVDGRAPKLHVRSENGEWEIRSVAGALSTHPAQEEALAAARSRPPRLGRRDRLREPERTVPAPRCPFTGGVALPGRLPEPLRGSSSPRGLGCWRIRITSSSADRRISPPASCCRQEQQRLLRDALIARSAKRVNATVVTYNTRDFAKIRRFCDIAVAEPDEIL
jgi:hypothetical protein